MSNYEPYKDSEIQWIGALPINWNITRGKYLFNFQKEINSNFQNDNLLSLTLSGVINKDINSSEGLRPKNYNTYQIFNKDDLVFKLIDLENKKTSRVGLVHERGIMSPVYIRIEPKQNSIFPKYAFWVYYDLYNKDIFNAIGTGVRSSLSSLDLLELEVPIPPKDEQMRIAKFVDMNVQDIDTLIEKVKEKIELLKEHRQALINQCVTKGLGTNFELKDSGVEWIGETPKHWRIVKLKYLVSYNDEILLKNTDPEYKFRYVQISDVNYLENITLGDLTSFKESPASARRIVKHNDIIVSTVRVNLRSIAIIPKFQDVICSTAFCVLRSNSKTVDAGFLAFSVGADSFVSEAIIRSTGVAYPTISSRDLVQIEIAVPPIDEQTKISKYLDTKINRLNDMISLEMKRVDLLKEYRQSLISAAVTGKIKITEDML